VSHVQLGYPTRQVSSTAFYDGVSAEHILERPRTADLSYVGVRHVRGTEDRKAASQVREAALKKMFLWMGGEVCHVRGVVDRLVIATIV
jgi:hypothetical protein